MNKAAFPKVAVVGAGYWGPNIIRNLMRIDPECLAWICDTNMEMLDRVSYYYPTVSLTMDIDKILSDESVKGVMLAIPPLMNHATATRVLAAGKNLFVEKPVSMNLNHVRELVALADEKSLALMVGHIYLYHQAIIGVGKQIKSGVIGKVRNIFSWRTNTNLRHKNTDILWSLLPHDCSILLDWLDRTPVEIAAKTWKINNGDTQDRARISLEFTSGCRAEIFLSWVNPVKSRRIIIIGESGAIDFDEIRSPSSALVYPMVPNVEGWTEEHGKDQDLLSGCGKPETKIFSEFPSEPLYSECMHFLECVKNGTKPFTNGENALAVHELIHRIAQSTQ